MPDEPVDTGEEETENQEEFLCRVCGIPLMTFAEAKIGVHIRCVYEKKHHTVNIPRPRYGTSDEQ